MDIPKKQMQWEQVRKAVPKESLELKEADVVRPAKGSGDVLVQVKCVALNHEWQTFHIFPTWLRTLPAVPELEMAGVIVDPGESHWKVGDEVFGIVSPHLPRSARGALCQYVLCKAVHIVRKPESLSWAEASGLAGCGLTAWRSMFVYYTKFQKGQRVFVHGGSTSVGRFAIQIAKANGAYVIASCSPQSEEGVRSNGADETVNYKAAPLHEQLAKAYPYKKSVADSPLAIHLIVDCVGDNQEIFSHSPSFMVPQGKLVRPGGDISKGFGAWLWRNVKNTAVPGILGGTPRQFKFFATSFGDTERVCDQVQILADLVNAGKLKVDVDSVNAYDQAGVFAAYDKSATGKARGKIVIKVSD